MVRPKENYAGHRIRELWVFVVTDANGDEGMPALRGPDGPVPMMATAARTLPKLREIARAEAKRLGLRFELRHFTGAFETLEVFEP